IHEGGEINGEPYIAMELVPGQNLRAFVDKPDVPLARKIHWLVEVARVLAAAHRAGIVHRDVKPENVMVRPDGRVKVLDFGIARRSAGPVDAAGPTAKALIPTVTASGGFVGTPMYVAPELLKGKPADGRSDQFSWAVLAYELLEGKSPWDGPDALGILATMMSEPAKPMQNEEVPSEVRAVIMRALSAAPASRHGSMEDIVELLQPFAEGEGKTENKRESASGAAKANSGSTSSRSTTNQRYSTQELGQAIALALERKAQADATGGKYDFDDLKAAAQEVGIAEAELRAALAALRPALPPLPEKWVDERRRAKQILQRHAAIWAACSVFFFAINMVTPGPTWFLYPVLSWWVGLAIHAITYFFPVESTPEEEAIREQFEQLRYQRIMGRLAEKRDKREKRTGPKLRVADRPEPSAFSAEDIEAAAEEEAAQELNRERKRRRSR
ncbi:MAG TPA: protein kinase, partial [Polyangium sp.]|nr:protein kinase [Polyangium sp.]